MDGKLIDGNIPQKSVQTAWQAVNHKNTSGNYFYKVVSRSDGYLVLQYSLTPKYSSTALNDRFIGPQNMMIVVTIIGIILIILVSSVRFGRKIRAKMTPLLNSIDKIKNQDLEYEVSYSGVKEIDDCISSIDDMKTAPDEIRSYKYLLCGSFVFGEMPIRESEPTLIWELQP